MRQDEGNGDSPVNAKYPPSVVKPATYYGEGEFDPPSSDDEDDAFLEKSLSRKTPGEGEIVGDGIGDDDVELVVGGQVRMSLMSKD